MGRLNDSSSLIYRYLGLVKDFLVGVNSAEAINLEAVRNNDFVLELFNIMTTQVK